ncbi:hypothetical protein POJ06DRAFT_106162 [Lipomyces tetrasporus]|uniref:Uncharacterized protein n=1 Tax=Lipomyces tetrasporus TaxID=54092 RepID=A0AAD7QSF7_9ASCO|nr:uncharacterized protein POJ06DRAFT_106162 [Lipomyces tetrasporus]KAJ8100530.1 hypothetical protein POJ06DRAFT_106162 [Lipomyces tetrasporus]
MAGLHGVITTQFGDALISVLKTTKDYPQGTIRCAKAVVTVLRDFLRRDTWGSYLTWSFFLGLLVVDVAILAASLTTYICVVVAVKAALKGQQQDKIRTPPPLYRHRGKSSRFLMNNSDALHLAKDIGSTESIDRARRVRKVNGHWRGNKEQLLIRS